MVNSRGSSSYQTFAAASLALALAFTVSSCGDDSKQEELEAESKAELAKLPKPIEDEFRAGDKNNDLRIQDTELEAMLLEAATTADADKNREITEAEIRPELGKNGDAKAALKPFDLDGDGRIPIAEYARLAKSHFMGSTDTSKDGQLAPREVAKSSQITGRPQVIVFKVGR